MSRLWVIPMVQTKSVGCFVQLMAARAGKKFSIRTLILARLPLRLSPQTQKLSTQIYGPRGKVPGKTAPGRAPAAVCTKLPMAETPGNNSPKASPHSNKVLDEWESQ